MRTVIIDDEAKGRQALKNFMAKYATNLELIGEADGVQAGIDLIEKEKPELVFLDIQMPDGTGFDLLAQLMYSDFKLIFCTSYDQYAVKAFRYSAIDYILKPIDPDVFKAAVNKVFESEIESEKEKIDVLKQNQKEITRLALNSADGINIVKLDDIIRCESSVNYTRFFINNASSIIVTKTLKEYDELLSPQGFARIHKSHLVNVSYITKYIKGEGGFVEFCDGTKVEVSRRKKEALLEALGGIL